MKSHLTTSCARRDGRRTHRWQIADREWEGDVLRGVSDINEIFGKYAAVEVHAGMVDSSAAQVVTKGTTSLAFSGTGKGVDLGLTFGEFDIQKQSAPRKRMRISSEQ
jgi:hypothetical protein